MRIETLKQRAQFVAASKSQKKVRQGFILQTLPQTSPKDAKFGFTVSKKVGNAPQRNRVKRRLKALIRDLDPMKLPASKHFVLVGRRAALYMPYERLQTELESAFASLNKSSSKSNKTHRE